MRTLGLSLSSILGRGPKKILSAHWEERNKILDPSNNFFCWSRELSEELQSYLRELTTQENDPIRITINQDNLSPELESARSQWDEKPSHISDLFWSDVEVLTRDFLEFSDKKSGTLHLRLIEDDACSKFHIDGYKLRLFVTYVGEGTEWLPESAVNRRALGSDNEDIVKDPSAIQRVGTGHVSILKGEIPGRFNPIKGIVHRSPPIAGTNEKRLILRVDLN